MRAEFQSAHKKGTSHRLQKKRQYGFDRALYDAVCLDKISDIPKLMKLGANAARVMPSITKDSHGRKVKSTALHMAVLQNRQAAMRAMIVYEPALNEKDVKGYTALHMACRMGNVVMAEILIRAGADRTIKGPDGRTALEMVGVEGTRTAPDSSTAREIQDLFAKAEGRDAQNSITSGKVISVMSPVQFKKPKPE